MRPISVLWLLLTLALPTSLLAQAFDRNAFITWVKDKLKTISDSSQPAEQRSAARDAIIAKAGPAPEGSNTPSPQDRLEMAQVLAGPDMVPPLLSSKDPVTALDAAMIAAKIRHLHFVQVLEAAVKSPQPTVRYWVAKGLADALPDMYNIGDKAFFENPLKALAAQAAREDSIPVAEELYTALNRTHPAVMADRAKNLVIYRNFMAAFRDRIKRVDAGKFDSLLAEVTGLKISGQWAELYSDDKPLRADIAFWQGQLLKWAAEIYAARKAELSEDRKGDLEQVMLKAADLLSSESGDQRLITDVRQALLAKPDTVGLQLAVVNFVGGAGMPTWTAKEKLGVNTPAAALTPVKGPATQP